MIAARYPFLTIDEYLTRERQSNEKHEYLASAVYMMAGASERHNAIKSAAELRLGMQLLNRGCRTYSSDMKVETPSGLVAYPDVIVVCGQAQLRDHHGDTLLNLIVLVEVLSPSTDLYDRTTKLNNYQTIASLQAYLLIASDSYRIERYARQPDGNWLYADAIGKGATLDLPSIQCMLRLEDVYADVTIEEA